MPSLLLTPNLVVHNLGLSDVSQTQRGIITPIRTLRGCDESLAPTRTSEHNSSLSVRHLNRCLVLPHSSCN